MTGLSLLTLMSTTGARFQSMPIAFSSEPATNAMASTPSRLAPPPATAAAIAIAPGNGVNPSLSRVTIPPSWSRATRGSTPLRSRTRDRTSPRWSYRASGGAPFRENSMMLPKGLRPTRPRRISMPARPAGYPTSSIWPIFSSNDSVFRVAIVMAAL